VIANTLNLDKGTPQKYTEPIFRSRMVHPAGTMMGERMQKAITLM